jgi:hypothetical protein
MTQSDTSRRAIAAWRKVHSITSSARSRIEVGTSSPSDFAVRRLIAIYYTPVELRALIARDAEKWANVIKLAGIEPEWSGRS